MRILIVDNTFYGPFIDDEVAEAFAAVAFDEGTPAQTREIYEPQEIGVDMTFMPMQSHVLH